jgi:hypothetical protein
VGRTAARLKGLAGRADPAWVPNERPIDRAFFRRTEAGTTVFFPWGLPHRGYELTDEAARAKASRAASLLIGGTLGIAAWAAHRLERVLASEANGLAEVAGALVAPGAALASVLLVYAWWVGRFVERFPESPLRVSREERLREAAEIAKPWQVALMGVALCALSMVAVWLKPEAWWVGALGVVLGAGLVGWSMALARVSSRPDP